MLSMYLMLIDTEDERAKFEQLYRQYGKLMHYVAKGILQDDGLAEDAVQEAFLRIAKNFHKVGEISCPQTRNFVVIITRNAALTMAKKSEPADTCEDMETVAGQLQSGEDPFAQVDHRRLKAEILALPEIYRDVLYLYGVYEYPLREIANLLGITVGAARKRLQRARKILMERIGEDDA